MNNWPVIIEGLAAGGFGTLLAAPLKAFLGRRKERVDNAEVVQGMALKMITPFEARLRETEQEVDSLRHKVRALNAELDAALAGRREAEEGRRLAEDQLLRYGIPFPTAADAREERSHG